MAENTASVIRHRCSVAAVLSAAVALFAPRLGAQTSLSIYTDGRVVVRRTLPQALVKGRNAVTLRIEGLEGATVHVGGEQRIGLVAVRGGIARDQRKRIEFGFGGGVRLGALGLDVGFWTHTNSLSNERGVTMATSFSIY